MAVLGQFWRPNSEGHFIPVLPNAQNMGSESIRLADVWINTVRLKGANNQLVIDANSSGQRSTIIFQNQTTNIGAFTFRNGSTDNWYISGYGGLGETFSAYTGLETNSFLWGEQDGDIFVGKAGATLYLTNSLYVPGKFLMPGFAVQSLVATNAVIATNMNILVQGSGAARTLTSTPTIAAPTIDTLIIITGNSDANTITLQDESALPGSLLRLQASTRVLGLYDKIGLLYSVAHSVWEEVFFSVGGGVVDTDDQIATEVPFTPAGTIAATSVQAAIEELDTEKEPVLTDSASLRSTLSDESGTGAAIFAGGALAAATATTAAVGDSDTSVATTAFVQGELPRFFKELNVGNPNLPASNPAVIDSGLVRRALLFDASTAQSASWTFALTNYRGGTLYCDVYFSFASATSGTAQFRGYIDAITPGTTSTSFETESYASANEGTATIAAATAGRIYKQTIVLNNADSAANGMLVVFKLDTDATDGTDDSATGNRQVRTITLYEE